jgi:hypothetical protein
MLIYTFDSLNASCGKNENISADKKQAESFRVDGMCIKEGMTLDLN